jgi:hypothetical protein
VGLFRDGKAMEREVITRGLDVHSQGAAHPSSCARKRESTAATGAENDFQVADVPAAQAAALPGGRGVAVTTLSDHGAAAQAGLKAGDVVLRLGKHGIRSPADLTAALRTFKPGATIPILIRRGGFDFWTAFIQR